MVERLRKVALALPVCTVNEVVEFGPEDFRVLREREVALREREAWRLPLIPGAVRTLSCTSSSRPSRLFSRSASSADPISFTATGACIRCHTARCKSSCWRERRNASS